MGSRPTPRTRGAPARRARNTSTASPTSTNHVVTDEQAHPLTAVVTAKPTCTAPAVSGVSLGAAPTAPAVTTLSPRPGGFQQFRVHQQQQMEKMALAANQVAMLQRTTSGGVAPEQFAAWSEQFAPAAAMAAQEQWKLATGTAYGSWPMGPLPFIPPATHAAVASTATTHVTVASTANTPAMPLPVRCTPYHPPVSLPHAASLTDSAMAMGGLARSLRKASKTAVASGSNYGFQAPTDDAECEDPKNSASKAPNSKGLTGSTGKDCNEATSVITPAEHQDDFSASAAPVAETAAPSAKAAVGLPSKRKRSSTHHAASRPLTDREKCRVSSHVATEQRRRDRINESFRVLREIVPHSDKTDKASFLGEVTAYIRKLQRLVGINGNGLGRPSGADSAIIGDSTSVAQTS